MSLSWEGAITSHTSMAPLDNHSLDGHVAQIALNALCHRLINSQRRYDSVSDVWCGWIDYSDFVLNILKMLLAASLCIDNLLNCPFEAIFVFTSQF
jgi:hypothetical protein